MNKLKKKQNKNKGLLSICRMCFTHIGTLFGVVCQISILKKKKKLKNLPVPHNAHVCITIFASLPFVFVFLLFFRDFKENMCAKHL